MVGTGKAKPCKDCRNSREICRFARPVPEGAVIEVSGDHSLRRGEKAPVETQGVRHRTPRPRAEVERPDREQVEALRPSHFKRQEDREAGVVVGGTSQAQVAKAKNSQALMARSL